MQIQIQNFKIQILKNSKIQPNTNTHASLLEFAIRYIGIMDERNIQLHILHSMSVFQKVKLVNY